MRTFGTIRKRFSPLLTSAVIVGLSILLNSACALAADTSQNSQLWGHSGEKWTPVSRLPDFSFAGYDRGESALPQRIAETDVKSFAAVGDGIADDTDAFHQAIEASKGKVLVIPPGRYKITDFLSLRASGSVLRGAGAGKSVLVFPVPLNDIKPNWGATTTGQRTSNYSWSGGFVHVSGSTSRHPLAQVTSPAKRGDQTLTVSDCKGLNSGDQIRLAMADRSDNSLATHIYMDDPGEVSNLKGRSRESFLCRLTKVDVAANRIEFDRPLRIDVRLHWKPQIYSPESTVEEVGIEDLGFEFPNTPYQGHFSEVGFNAIAISGARNCWVRGVRIHNADSGIFISGTNTTLRDIQISSDRKVERSRNATGHHGITLGGQDNLLTDFDIRTRFMHDITFTRGSAGNVVSSGRGVDLALDHHRYGPHSNLFTDIDLGVGSRMFQSGGGARLGRHSGAFETFWNIRAEKPQTWPTGWGPQQMNFVGVHSELDSSIDRDGQWFEVIGPDKKLEPIDLYQAQLARRLATKK
jgi:hypothetical protein